MRNILNKIKHGMYTVLLHNIPVYDKVRVIYATGIGCTGYIDGVKEFTFSQVMNDPALIEIKRRLE